MDIGHTHKQIPFRTEWFPAVIVSQRMLFVTRYLLLFAAQAVSGGVYTRKKQKSVVDG